MDENATFKEEIQHVKGHIDGNVQPQQLEGPVWILGGGSGHKGLF